MDRASANSPGSGAVCTTLPATGEFTRDEIHAVDVARDEEWNGKRVPTVAQLTLCIAVMGGYAGKSNGPRGMIVLARGWWRVAPIVCVFVRLRSLQIRSLTL